MISQFVAWMTRSLWMWLGSLLPSARGSTAYTSWEGITIIARVPNLALRLIDDSDPKHVLGPLKDSAFKVVGERGEWLWIGCPGVDGWILKDEAIRLADAIDYFNERIEKDPKDLFAFSQLARACQVNRDQYLAILEQARAEQPDFAGEVEGILQDLDTQIGELRKSTLGSSWLERGNNHLELKQYEEALKAFDEAISLDPENAAAFNNRGKVRSDQKEYEKAIADYDQSLRLDSTSALTFMNRGIAHKSLKQHEQALADYEQAIHLDPIMPKVYLNRALLWKAERKFGEALRDYEKAATLDPNYANAHNNIAWLLATCPDPRFRDGAKALAAARRSCELTGWKIADRLDTYAAACAEAGDFAEAVRWQQQVIAASADRSPEASVASAKRLELYNAQQPFREGEEEGGCRHSNVS